MMAKKPDLYATHDYFHPSKLLIECARTSYVDRLWASCQRHLALADDINILIHAEIVGV